MQTIRINAQLTWNLVSGGPSGYVAECAPLKLTAEGETWEELVSVIAETIDDYLRARLIEGDLEATLSRLGWAPMPMLAHMADPGAVHFDVPVNLQQAA